MPRLLVLRGGALGDFLILRPLLHALRRRWPAARIELVGNAVAAGLGLSEGVLDAAHAQSESRWAQLYADAPLTPEFATWLKTFDLIVSYWPDSTGELGRQLDRLGLHWVSGGPRPETSPAAAHFFAPWKSFGVEQPATWHVPWSVPAAAAREAERRLAGARLHWALHAGSGSAQKNWPRERWTALIARYAQPALAIIGEAERHSSALEWPATVLRVEARNWPLPVLAAALRSVEHYVGHDTGVSHLAAAVGVPCTLLFGPTDPAIWAPPGAHVTVCRRGVTLDALAVDEVVSVWRTGP